MMKKMMQAIVLSVGLTAPSVLLAQKPSAPASLSPMLQKVTPAVVNLMTAGKLDLTKNPLIKEELQNLPKKDLEKLSNFTFQAAGSGVIINAKKGIIITNAHVIEQAQTIIVNLNDGRRYAAKVLGEDEAADIAVLQIHAPDLTAIPFGNSEKLSVGDFVVAIGNPFGLQQTVTSGIVSGLHRSDLDLEGYENFIQTDAPINQGNSGGALINGEGQLIGINTAILSSGDNGGSIGIGFAIPSNMARTIADQIIQYGKVKHGSLGILVQTLSPQLASALQSTVSKGALVSEVVQFSPAQEAGIQAGDIITSVNDIAINNNGQLRAFVGSLREGTELTIKLIRGGKSLTIKVKTGDMHKTIVQQKMSNPFLYGLELRDVSGQTSDLNAFVGVEVLHAEINSLAWSMGVAKGDIIVAANGQTTPDIATLDKVTADAKGPVLLQVVRQGKSFFVSLG